MPGDGEENVARSLTAKARRLRGEGARLPEARAYQEGMST